MMEGIGFMMQDKIECKKHGISKSVHIGNHDYMCFECYKESIELWMKNLPSNLTPTIIEKLQKNMVPYSIGYHIKSDSYEN